MFSIPIYKKELKVSLSSRDMQAQILCNIKGLFHGFTSLFLPSTEIKISLIDVLTLISNTHLRDHELIKFRNYSEIWQTSFDGKKKHLQAITTFLGKKKYHLIQGHKTDTWSKGKVWAEYTGGSFHIHRIRNECVWTKAKADSNKQIFKIGLFFPSLEN